jgi:hypothetical protein
MLPSACTATQSGQATATGRAGANASVGARMSVRCSVELAVGRRFQRPQNRAGLEAKRFCFLAELPTLADWGVAFVLRS